MAVFDEDKGEYTPEMVQCVMELSNYNVAAGNVAGVIHAVSKLCGRVPNQAVSSRTVSIIVYSSKAKT
jgi:hypothetical protein